MTPDAPNPNYTVYLLAALGSLAALFWSQLRAFGSSISSRLAHHHTLGGDSASTELLAKLVKYLNDHCRPLLDLTGPAIISRFLYLNRLGRRDAVVARLHYKPNQYVLYKTPRGLAWVNAEIPAKLRWIRGTLDSEQLLVDIARMDVRNNDERPIASITRLSGDRQRIRQMRTGGQGQPPVSGEAPAYENENGHGRPPTQASDSDTRVLTSSILSRLLTHSADDFRQDEAAADLVVMDAAMDQAVSAVSRWQEGRDWYRTRHIPWRYGLMLVGLPGTGKTNTARYLSSRFNMPIYAFDLASMTNDCFIKCWGTATSSQFSTPGIILLFEDFDAVFDLRKNVVDSECGVTFDAILNTIDGVQSNDGILLLITTNHPEKIDAALGMRPGRIERIITFTLPDAEWRRECLSRILGDWPDIVARLVDLTHDATQSTVVQTAISVGLFLAHERVAGGARPSPEQLTEIVQLARDMNKNNQLVLTRWRSSNRSVDGDDDAAGFGQTKAADPTNY
jgi:hypothetical protein